ncbi:MAG: protein jag [Clostridia bacterium]|nr:protein jag [Clostridia bacterium]
MEENNVFTGKTLDEAINEGLIELRLTRDEAEITVLEEGKKKLFGSVKAKVQITKKSSDGKKAQVFIEKLLKIMGVKSECEVLSDDASLSIEIKTPSSARVIGKRGDVLDAIQTIAGAYTNIGKDEYKKVVVDCENYRAQREQTLKELALKLAAKAIETGRKMTLEPMTPYERRIIHATLMDNDQIKTISEGTEPLRYIAVIPYNAKPYDRGVRYGEKRPQGRDNRFGDRDRRGNRGDRRDGGRDRGGRGGDRRPSGGGKPRGKKEIYFGAFLGNSKNTETEVKDTPVNEEENKD